MKDFYKNINTTFEQLIFDFSDILNLADERLHDHHKQVAYIAYKIANGLNLPLEKIKEVLMIALIHDIGVFKKEEITSITLYDDADAVHHSIRGYLLLKDLDSLNHMAEVIRWHHNSWEYGKGFKNIDSETVLMSQIIYLADRVAILAETFSQNILSNSDEILSIIENDKGNKFNPELVDILREISSKPSFWLDIKSTAKEQILKYILTFKPTKLSYENFIDVSKLFIYSIYFRSRYTATHTIGVSAIAERLSKLCDMSENDCGMMKIAGYFHDIGKLTIPVEILEKPSKLTSDEFNIIKKHTYHTYHIIDNIKGLEEIKNIASYHHETLDEKGYPFRVNKAMLNKKCRLMCVADIFTALTENRPYRHAMKKDQVTSTLLSMANNNKIDKAIVATVIDNYEELNEYNKIHQNEAMKDFSSLQSKMEELLK